MKVFGVGELWSVPADGSEPVKFGVLQDVALDFSFESKQLHGRDQFPVAVARGKGQCNFKAKFAEIRAKAFNQLLNGTITAGMTKFTELATFTVASGSATGGLTTAPTGFTVTDEMGLFDVTDPAVAVPLILVTGAPTAGEYSVATTDTSITYTVPTAVGEKTYQFSYEYTLTTGKTLTVANARMGASPVFSVKLYTGQTGSNSTGQLAMKFFYVTSSKLALTMKNDDFLVPEFDMSAFADSSGNVVAIYCDE